MEKKKREIKIYYKKKKKKGKLVLGVSLEDKDKAIGIIRTEIHSHYDVIINNLDTLNNDIDLWTNSIQRIVAFVTSKNETVNILVDDVIDIINVTEEEKQKLSQVEEGEIVQFDCAIELQNGKIATIINDINI